MFNGMVEALSSWYGDQVCAVQEDLCARRVALPLAFPHRRQVRLGEFEVLPEEENPDICSSKVL